MKTKAFKLKENIARYMYKYIGMDDVSIRFNNDTGVYEKWEIHVGGKIGEQYGLSYIDKKRKELEDILGFEICFCSMVIWDGTVGTTLLWNKEKEEKYRQYWNRKREEVIPRDWETYTNCELMRAVEWTIDKAIKNKLI